MFNLRMEGRGWGDVGGFTDKSKECPSRARIAAGKPRLPAGMGKSGNQSRRFILMTKYTHAPLQDPSGVHQLT